MDLILLPKQEKSVIQDIEIKRKQNFKKNASDDLELIPIDRERRNQYYRTQVSEKSIKTLIMFNIPFPFYLHLLMDHFLLKKSNPCLPCIPKKNDNEYGNMIKLLKFKMNENKF